MATGRSELSLASVLDAVGLDGLVEDDDEDDDAPCTCDLTIDEGVLLVDASGCDNGGDLRRSPHCRASVVRELADHTVDGLVVRASGLEYRYGDRALDLLGTAGRFVDLLGDRDERLARAAATDPLSVVDEVDERVGPVADIATQSGLVGAAAGVETYDDALSPTVGLTVGHYFVDRAVDDGARLRDVTELPTGSTARVYGRDDSVPLYSLDVVDVSLSVAQRELLLEGYEAIAKGLVEGDRRASRAIEYVSDGEVDPILTAILGKHTQGYGVLEDLFADPRVTDVYATSPVEANPIRVEVDGQAMSTNVHLTADGGGALASRIRRTSGRAFSRAAPTVDATADLENGTGLRVAGVTDPVAEGVAFAFREQAEDTFTLPELVRNGTMPAEAAGFLSVAIERNAAALIAGTRGAGKTTLLGTLLYEVTPDTRTVVIEDTPELPVDQLQRCDRDVQPLRTGTGGGPEISAADALRTALRLGDGALVVGEIRGEEARVLYEAMRVGASANAVLGTIHGDGADEVFERVVSDLGVPPSSFGATDLVVTVQAYRTPTGRKRRLSTIEEVIVGDDEIRFAPLYEIEGDIARSTDRIDRGESRFLDRLTGPAESYADVREAVIERGERLERIAGDGRTSPTEVAAAYAGRGVE
ncbi:type II/IV secretion system ATPase subunit [Halosimplex pelagicum]|uniref:Type II/IV secretion system ATPase subunit n=1 Tax=Halosimplex pelagicum TaxID=869886 RepID=A0A7D5TA29_9EURY|nr:type II/IV secretion system ATPase subunit [Halosimplex pelagicum]QLH80155.1 type II/IV secretion system ATPase subunit [Halosimplex pelagicum]